MKHSREVSPRFLELARKVLGGRRPIICDVGSRDAAEGLVLLRELRGKELHVFGPNPPAAAECRKNLSSAAEWTDAAIVFNELAVTSRNGVAEFFPVNPEVSENKDLGFSSLFKINPEYTKRRGKIVQDTILVRTITLDSYFQDRAHPDLSGVDVEERSWKSSEGRKLFSRVFSDPLGSVFSAQATG